MFELLVLVLFGWLFVSAIRLIFKAAWGLAKIAAIILIIAAFPTLIGVLMIAGGIALLIPVALIGVAFGILKGCI
ncbi:MAG: hypothetical protein J6A74_06480 [Oscillospiraceae bacterium]|nr:hypothetical protein [Oscillospiraceae bacterium]